MATCFSLVTVEAVDNISQAVLIAKLILPDPSLFPGCHVRPVAD